MITQTKSIQPKYIPFKEGFSFNEITYELNESAFFDIETTGFQAESSILYLIGCMYWENNKWYITQWLATQPDEESMLLQCFTDFLSNRKLVIHFNGTTFDIPYLNKKYKQLGIVNVLPTKESLDIYKEIRPIKKILPTENYKLTTLCKLIGIPREDNYSGGELINVFRQFIAISQIYELKTKNNTLSMNQSENAKQSLLNIQAQYITIKDVLLLHNFEDIEALIYLYTLCLTKKVFLEPKEMLEYTLLNVTTTDNEIYVTIPYKKPLYYDMEFVFPLINYMDGDSSASTALTSSCTLSTNQLQLRIPIYHGTLKYFFSNYKDYYYLPMEDIAMHKSVSEYVDKDYRKKATKETCYIKKSGNYIPCLLIEYKKNNHKDKNNYPKNSFFMNYNDKLYFTELDSFLSNSLEDTFEQTCNILGHILSIK